MRFQLAVAALVNIVFLNIKANMAENMAVEVRQINMGIHFYQSQIIKIINMLIAIYSELVPRSRSKAIEFSRNCLVPWLFSFIYRRYRLPI